MAKEDLYLPGLGTIQWLDKGVRVFSCDLAAPGLPLGWALTLWGGFQRHQSLMWGPPAPAGPDLTAVLQNGQESLTSLPCPLTLDFLSLTLDPLPSPEMPPALSSQEGGLE